MRIEQRPAQTNTNRRATRFARQQNFAAHVLQVVCKHTQLRRLAATINSFESNKSSGHLFPLAGLKFRQEFKGMSRFRRVGIGGWFESGFGVSLCAQVSSVATYL